MRTLSTQKLTRTTFSVLLLIAGIGLCAFHTVTSAFVDARSTTLYRDKIMSVPFKETYTRAEVTEAAWQVWTNRVRLPAKDSYTVGELKDGVFGLGIHQDFCNRQTFEAVIARASGFKRDNDSGMLVLGILAMLAGAFLLGGVLFPISDKKPA